MENSIRLSLKPIGGEIERAGQKSSNFLKSHGFSNKAVDTQIMILRELINNGIKYGKFTPSESEITVNIFISEKAITFEVKNPVDESCLDKLKELDKTVSDMWIDKKIKTTKDLQPFPLLGIPGWWNKKQDEAFYLNDDYFRRKNSAR